MAQRKPQALKQVVIDGEISHVPDTSRIVDVVPSEVTAVQVVDAQGRSRMLARSEFHAPVPEGFTTHQTAVARGAAKAAVKGVP